MVNFLQDLNSIGYLHYQVNLLEAPYHFIELALLHNFHFHHHSHFLLQLPQLGILLQSVDYQFIDLYYLEKYLKCRLVSSVTLYSISSFPAKLRKL
jgi:hypothetical protein